MRISDVPHESRTAARSVDKCSLAAEEDSLAASAAAAAEDERLAAGQHDDACG